MTEPDEMLQPLTGPPGSNTYPDCEGLTKGTGGSRGVGPGGPDARLPDISKQSGTCLEHDDWRWRTSVSKGFTLLGGKSDQSNATMQLCRTHCRGENVESGARVIASTRALYPVPWRRGTWPAILAMRWSTDTGASLI